MRIADLHYYGPPQTRFPSREAWRDCEQSWEPPLGPHPVPRLRIDDGEEHPVSIRQATAAEISARIRAQVAHEGPRL